MTETREGYWLDDPYIATRIEIMRRWENDRGFRPSTESMDRLKAFIERNKLPIRPLVTASDDGWGVIEFHDGDYFGDVEFMADGKVEVYSRPTPGETSTSKFVEGELGDQEILNVLFASPINPEEEKTSG